jgi:DNA modification methylase
MNIELKLGDCLEVLKTIPDNSIDSVVTDPPYGIGFMGKAWDTFEPEYVKKISDQSLESFKKHIDEKQDNPNLKGRKKNSAIGNSASNAGTYDLSTKGKNEYQQWCYEWGKECLRILKPGGHLLASNSPRMYHRMAIGLEDAGFEIRDQIMWVYGSGFPKSHNIGKKIDNWEGWGTALKPAHEPIVMARKPLSEKSIAENVLKHGTGGINIDDSRIEFEDTKNAATNPKFRKENNYKMPEPGQESNGAVKFTSSKNEYDTSGRFPANIIFDEEAGQILDEQAPLTGSAFKAKRKKDVEGGSGASLMREHKEGEDNGYRDERGGASRFFYCPKASKKDRNEGLDGFELKEPQSLQFAKDGSFKENKTAKSGIQQRILRANNHPTVKPTDLMRYLIKLVTPPNGTVLDPFMGSGSTGKAAVRAGFNFVGIEKEQEYMDIAKARIEHEKNKPTQTELFD